MRADAVSDTLLELSRCPVSRPRRVSAWANRVISHIGSHLDEPLTNRRLAAFAQLSPIGFQIRFKRETGVPPATFVLRKRIEAARTRLANSRDTVTDVALDLGFGTSQYFASAFKREVGMSPVAYRRLADRQTDEPAPAFRAQRFGRNGL